MRFIFSLLLIIIVAACNTKSDSKNKKDSASNNAAQNTAAGWDSTNRYEFINECMQGERVQDMAEAKAYDYCNCMLQKLEAQFPVPDSLLHIDTLVIDRMEEDCLK